MRECQSLSLWHRLRYRGYRHPIMLFGLGPIFLFVIPIILLAASIGTWLFDIRHQFDPAYWASGPDWDFHAAALRGSSFYDLPAVLHWLTGYIGFHHIDHVCSKIPN